MKFSAFILVAFFGLVSVSDTGASDSGPPQAATPAQVKTETHGHKPAIQEDLMQAAKPASETPQILPKVNPSQIIPQVNPSVIVSKPSATVLTKPLDVLSSVDVDVPSEETLAPTPTKHLVEIKKFKFSIPKLDVKVGDEVTWINLDIVPHTATALDRSWDTGLLDTDESYTLVITDDTSLAYFCLYHQQMKAEFVMGEAQDEDQGLDRVTDKVE